jgi:hypothetical protein
VILEPTFSLRCVIIIMYYVLMFGVMLISPIPYLFVLLRVDEPVTEDPCVQQVEVAEQELIEGKLCP